MKIAVLSDIHSNYAALEECLVYALSKGIEYFLFLGDYISDIPYPQRSMLMLYDLSEKYKCWFIRGNREEYMTDYRLNGEKGWINGSCSGSLLYTYNNLTNRDFEFFKNIPNKLSISIPEYPSFNCCHGSMNFTRELLNINSENAKKALECLETDTLICGHTHVQGTFEYMGKRLINPGSVGIPWYYDGKAQFAIIHGTKGEWHEEYIQLDYDRDKILKAYETSGLNELAPMWSVLIKEAIKTGRDSTCKVLARAMEMCREETGEANWPYIPEKYWETAIAEQGISKI